MRGGGALRALIAALRHGMAGDQRVAGGRHLRAFGLAAVVGSGQRGWKAQPLGG